MFVGAKFRKQIFMYKSHFSIRYGAETPIDILFGL